MTVVKRSFIYRGHALDYLAAPRLLLAAASA